MGKEGKGKENTKGSGKKGGGKHGGKKGHKGGRKGGGKNKKYDNRWSSGHAAPAVEDKWNKANWWEETHYAAAGVDPNSKSQIRKREELANAEWYGSSYGLAANGISTSNSEKNGGKGGHNSVFASISIPA